MTTFFVRRPYTATQKKNSHWAVSLWRPATSLSSFILGCMSIQEVCSFGSERFPTAIVMSRTAGQIAEARSASFQFGFGALGFDARLFPFETETIFAR